MSSSKHKTDSLTIREIKRNATSSSVNLNNQANTMLVKKELMHNYDDLILIKKPAFSIQNSLQGTKSYSLLCNPMLFSAKLREKGKPGI